MNGTWTGHTFCMRRRPGPSRRRHGSRSPTHGVSTSRALSRISVRMIARTELGRSQAILLSAPPCRLSPIACRASQSTVSVTSSTGRKNGGQTRQDSPRDGGSLLPSSTAVFVSRPHTTHVDLTRRISRIVDTTTDGRDASPPVPRPRDAPRDRRRDRRRRLRRTRCQRRRDRDRRWFRRAEAPLRLRPAHE